MQEANDLNNEEATLLYPHMVLGTCCTSEEIAANGMLSVSAYAALAKVSRNAASRELKEWAAGSLPASPPSGEAVCACPAGLMRGRKQIRLFHYYTMYK